ncbi:MAG: NAD(P)/FAD-dependent oxidoreductase [Candidatus Altimarinota bacterium]
MKRIAIIGAGPAGLMSAATLLERNDIQDFQIHIFEKNSEPGKKLLLSGGGRCNITTAIDDKKVLQMKYVRGWDFIKKAMGKFGPKKCYEWFEGHGLRLKVEPEARVFPISDNARDVLGVFHSLFAKYRNRIFFHYGEGVIGIQSSAHDFLLHSAKSEYIFDIVVIATGGNAYSHTGSTGDGYSLAREFGHTISMLGPSLSSFLTKETWIHELSGIAFEKAKINQKLHGGLILTHFGISGPLAFMLSAEIAWINIGKGSAFHTSFSPRADMGFKEWDNFLKEGFERSPKKFLITILSEKVPKRFSEIFVKEFFPGLLESFVGGISKKSRDDIAKLLGEGIPITLLERRAGDEFVTAGGVNTHEIHPETMESKIQKNLYFAGEILNVDGYTGGFSLQICWASGYVVGKSIH